MSTSRLLGFVCLLCLSTHANATTWDFAADFDASVFDYGIWSNIEHVSGYHSFTATYPDCFGGVAVECHNDGLGNNVYPAVAINRGANPTFDVMTAGADTVAILSQAPTVVSFTAPAAGNYSFVGSFVSIAPDSFFPTATTFFFIFDPQQPSFPLEQTININPLGNAFPFSLSFNLAAGDRIDFGGADGIVGLRGTISSDAVASVPEPASWLSMLFGFALMGLACRRTPIARRAA